jgi:TonB family protein
MFFTGLALKSTAVLACAWFITMLLRGRSAAWRHLVWTAASAAVLGLPLMSVSLPAWRVPVSSTTAGPASFEVSGSARALSQPRSARSGSATPASQPAGRRPIDWAPIALSIWAVGALLALARMLSAWIAIERLRHSAKPFFDTGLCGALAKTLRVGQPVDFLETRSGSMPMTFGILRSAILLPADASEWSEERMRVVLLHELAHVRRGDVATHVLARLALIAYWWNPLAWLAWREFVKERERAADDLVLNAGTAASDYARHLLDVARGMQLAPATGWAAVAMVRRSQLETRLRAILDSGVNRTAAGRASALVTALLAVALIAPLAAVRAQSSTPAAVPADLDAAIRAARSQKNYDILDTAARAAGEARQYDVAEKLLEAAAAIRGEVSGNPSREYGLGLLKLATLQQRRHENGAAEASYAKAAQMLGEDPQAAPALLYLGTAALIKKNYSQATEYFQHAQQIDAASAGMALMWSAIVMEKQNNNDEADALFRRAVAQQYPKSPEAATILTVYSRFLNTQGRESEAAELDTRAAALRKSPPAPPSQSELPAGVYRIGGGVLSPKVLEKKEPEYTDEARAAKLSGTEVLLVQIGPDGLAHNIQVVRGLGLGLDENGVDAISQWRFQPGSKDGQPVAVLASIEINFRLL